MKKWFSLFFVLLIIATGCQTYRGDGAAAGAGTYPLKTSPAGEDTVLITVVDSSKAGGFDIRRTPMANIPVSTPVQTALNLKQDASTAVTADDVQDAIDEAIAGVDGSTIAADTTDPTKAAAAVAADSATYATTAGTAGTVAAVSGDAVTSGTIADARIASTIARDSEVSASISSAIAGKFDTPTGTTSQVVLGDGTLGSLPAGSTITADTTDNTKAAAAVVADSASALTPSKVSGVPSVNFFHEANGTDTNGNGFIGPLNATKNYLFRIDAENGTVAVDQVLKVGAIATNQTVTMGAGSMVADIVTLILADESGGGASVEDDAYSSSWDGDTAAAASKNALYDKISALETQVSDMIAAFSAAGLNSFSFDPVTTFPLYSNTATPVVSVDVTDTSTAYAVSSVLYKIDAGEYTGNTMTNTAGNTWAATLSTLSEGSHDIRFQASDDKSTPNTGESAAYAGAIVVDLTNPVVGTITPSSLTHDGTGATLTATVASITEANEDYRQWSLYDVTDAAIQTDWTTFTGLSISGISIPADQHTYRIDVRVYDLAGNVGTASSSNIVYEAVGGALIEWDGTGSTLQTYVESSTVTTTNSDFTSGHIYVDADGTANYACTDGQSIDLNKGTIEFTFVRRVAPDAYGMLFHLGSTTSGAGSFCMLYYETSNSDSNIQFRYNGNRINFPISSFDASGIQLNTEYVCKFDWDNTVGSEIHNLTIGAVTSAGTFVQGTSLGTKPTISSNIMYVGVDSTGTYRSMSEIRNWKVYDEVQ